jgi:hypothetical protein
VSAAWVAVKVESESANVTVRATVQAAALRLNCFNFMLFPVFFVEKRKERKKQQKKPNENPNPLFAVGVFLSTTVLFHIVKTLC